MTTQPPSNPRRRPVPKVMVSGNYPVWPYGGHRDFSSFLKTLTPDDIYFRHNDGFGRYGWMYPCPCGSGFIFEDISPKKSPNHRRRWKKAPLHLFQIPRVRHVCDVDPADMDPIPNGNVLLRLRGQRSLEEAADAWIRYLRGDVRRRSGNP